MKVTKEIISREMKDNRITTHYDYGIWKYKQTRGDNDYFKMIGNSELPKGINEQITKGWNYAVREKKNCN